jgi:hypothetical protein
MANTTKIQEQHHLAATNRALFEASSVVIGYDTRANLYGRGFQQRLLQMNLSFAIDCFASV